MPIARRGLLGLGALAALSPVISACRALGEGNAQTTRPPVGSTHPVDPTQAPEVLFFGQPSAGSVYYGASLPDTRSLPAWESTLGSRLAVNRSYFTYAPGVNVEIAVRCRDDLVRDRLPHVSVKPPGTWHDVASGAQDPWLSDLLQGLRGEDGPVLLTLHHEPENDAGAPGMLPPDFVGMQRRAVDRAASLAPNVTIVPVLQHWTFDPLRKDIDPREWVTREAAVFGVDIYNPWSPDNGKEWRTFSSLTEEVLPWTDGKPVVIGEYGCREDPQNPGLTSQWLRAAADYGRGANVVAMSYFNSGVNTPQGTLSLGGESEVTFAELLASPWVARPG